MVDRALCSSWPLKCHYFSVLTTEGEKERDRKKEVDRQKVRKEERQTFVLSSTSISFAFILNSAWISQKEKNFYAIREIKVDNEEREREKTYLRCLLADLYRHYMLCEIPLELPSIFLYLLRNRTDNKLKITNLCEVLNKYGLKLFYKLKLLSSLLGARIRNFLLEKRVGRRRDYIPATRFGFWAAIFLSAAHHLNVYR